MKSYENLLMADIVLNGERLKAFCYNQEQDGYLFLPLLFDIVVEVLACLNRQEKCFQIRKEGVKLSLFTNLMISYVENTFGEIYLVSIWEDSVVLQCEFSQMDL